jgi:putative ABC transport system permease protein
MSLWKIAWRSIQQRSLASTLTAVSMGLGVMLVVAVLVVGYVIDNHFRTGAGMGYNLVIGKKGGEYQLVLNTVYYLGKPIENIPWSYYKEFLPAGKRGGDRDGKFAAHVEKVVPCNLGDYYEGYRVIGTTPAMFDELELVPGKPFEFAAGENFKQDEFFTGVVGATVAKETGLRVGDTFKPTHASEDGHEHEDEFTIVGILDRTGTPIDRALYINIEGFFLLEGHAMTEDLTKFGESEGAKGHSHDDSHEAEKRDADHKHDEDHKHEADDKHATEHKHEQAEKDEHDHAHDETKGAESHEHEHANKEAAKPHNHEHAHGAHDHAHNHGHSHSHGHDHSHDHGHHHHHDPLPEEQREVTAILVLTKSYEITDPRTGHTIVVPPESTASQIIKPINKDVVAQAVQPISVIYQFLSTFLKPLQWTLLALTVLIVIVAATSILVSIYNSMSERRREIAVMRALGAGRTTVMQIMLAESILLAVLGGLAGWAAGHGILALVSPWLTEKAGVGISAMHLAPGELWLVPGIIALASVVGFLPALTAYRTDVAEALTANP